MTYRTTRPGVWLPPAAFLFLSALVVVGAPDLGTRLFYVAFTVLTGCWFVRARRAGVEIGEAAVVVRGQFRTRRIPFAEIRAARAEPMRTASPLASRWPYIALALDLSDGGSRQFEEVSAAASQRGSVDVIVDAINSHLRGRS